MLLFIAFYLFIYLFIYVLVPCFLPGTVSRVFFFFSFLFISLLGSDEL